MPVTLDAASADVLGVMENVMAEHFPDLVDLVEVEVLMATGAKGRPAVKLAGSPVTAKIKRVPREQKAVNATGGPDVRIIVDAKRFADMKPRRREALFAHELEHIELIRDAETGECVRDDYDRPKIRLRADDWLITGFKRIHDLYGEDSCERSSFEALGFILGQRVFDFMQADEPDTRPFPRRKRGDAEQQATA